MSSTNKRTVLLLVWLGLLGGLFAAITHFTNQTQAPPKRATLPAQFNAGNFEHKWPDISSHFAAPPIGSPAAPYTIVEFGDFQCPQCAKMRPILEDLLRRSSGRANLSFVHRPFPFDQFGRVMHKYALGAAEAAQAAAAQGKFWPMYDVLYQHHDDLEPANFGDYAKKAGLNLPEFLGDMASHKYAAQVKASADLCQSFGILETPSVAVHDNRTGKVTLYVGSDSTQPGGVDFPGVVQLAANPPWPVSPKTAAK